MTEDTKNLSARGIFWLSGYLETMTIESATRGILTIESDGKIRLNLDKDEWKWGEVSDTMESIYSKEFAVVGYLTDLQKYARLERAYVAHAHPFSPNGFMVTDIGAFICMVSEPTLHDLRAQALANVVRIPLGSLRAWLNRTMPEAVSTDNGFEVQYPAEPDFTYSLPSGKLIIESQYKGSYDFTQRSLTMTHEACIELQLSKATALTKLANLHLDIEDLLVLLCNFDVALSWPIIRFPDIDVNCTLYYTRRKSLEVTFSALECWILFSEIKDCFGEIMTQWLERREAYGPALHLYLGTRRNLDMYQEHAFVNLVWGLEALHRRIGPTHDTSRMQEKIQRILSRVDVSLSGRDRKWLENRLDFALEPTLADRLYAICHKLPLRVPDDQLRAFANRCAKLRNEISHSGGPTSRSDYAAFILELHHLARALNYIYHATILLLIGISPHQIERVLFENHGSFIIRSYLRDANLQPCADANSLPSALLSSHGANLGPPL